MYSSNQCRALANRQDWTVDFPAAFVKGEMGEPKRTIERILQTGPVESVIPYTYLIELYQNATAKPAEGKPIDKGYCADGCGQRVIGGQKFAQDILDICAA
jgi:hypothetical protein